MPSEQHSGPVWPVEWRSCTAVHATPQDRGDGVLLARWFVSCICTTGSGCSAGIQTGIERVWSSAAAPEQKSPASAGLSSVATKRSVVCVYRSRDTGIGAASGARPSSTAITAGTFSSGISISSPFVSLASIFSNASRCTSVTLARLRIIKPPIAAGAVYRPVAARHWRHLPSSRTHRPRMPTRRESPAWPATTSHRA